MKDHEEDEHKVINNPFRDREVMLTATEKKHNKLKICETSILEHKEKSARKLED